MPITTHAEHVERYGGDKDHWSHVMETLFVPAIEAAGFRPIRPIAEGSHLIHGLIIKNLSEADLVLVDLSSHNPNVFFELGVRTSLNLPIALVKDEHMTLPFDTSGINTHAYDSRLNVWDIEDERRALVKHLADSSASCGGENPLWRQFGLTMRASEPNAAESPLEAKVDLLASHLLTLEEQLAGGRPQVQESPASRFIEAVVRYEEVGVVSNMSTLSATEVVVGYTEEPSPAALAGLGQMASSMGVDVLVTSPAGAVRLERPDVV